MQSKLGFNIETKSAKEQDLFISDKNAANYYEEDFEHSLKKRIKEIIDEIIPDVDFDISSSCSYLKNGNCLNSIIITVHNQTGFDKKLLREKLQKYINNHFKYRFSK